MVIHNLSTGFALFALFLSVAALIRLHFVEKTAKQYMQECHDYAQQAAETSPRAQMAQVQTELTDLADSYSSLIASHKRLRSRIGMREKRERDQAQPKNGTDRGNVPSDPGEKAQYKQQLRVEMRERGMLR